MKTTSILPGARTRAEYLFVVIIMLFSQIDTSGQEINQGPKVKAILESFAADYLNDSHFKENWVFGVKVDDSKWTIKTFSGDEGKSTFQVLKGFPEEPSFYFNTTYWALKEIDEGRMNALTGAVKAFSTDYAPFDMEVMDGYQPGEDFVAKVVPFMFHFWTKGTPEIIPFGPEYTRATHGAQASIFYYQPGLRSGWGILYPGQHANEHPKSKTNDFPSLIIFTKGKVVARLDGNDYEVEEGNALFIPPGMEHEFLNPFKEAAEFILLMFGDGA